MATTTAPSESSGTPESNGKTALTDAIREHFSGDAPITDKVKSFAKDRPWTSAAFAGIVAVAAANLLRGRI